MDTNAILEVLQPVPGNETWDYFLYVLFVVGMATLLLMGGGKQRPKQMETFFITGAVFFVLLDKIYIFGFIFAGPESLDFIDPSLELPLTQRVNTHLNHLASYILRVGIFVLPLVVVGSTRSGRVRVLAGVFAVVGAAYSFGRWWFQLFDERDLEPQTMIFAQGTLLILIGGELLSRWYGHRRSREDG